jgi:hypothetical protein
MVADGGVRVWARDRMLGAGIDVEDGNTPEEITGSGEHVWAFAQLRAWQLRPTDAATEAPEVVAISSPTEADYPKRP